MNTLDLITKKTKLLPLDKQDQILDFVEFLIVKYEQENKKSAEEKAIERLKDMDDMNNPDSWETIIDVDDEIDIESSLENLRKRGYKIKIPS